MDIKFITPTQLSLIDITSMGDSVKRDDPNTIGTFDSGLKYAIALLLRAGVDINIHVKGDSFENFFTFDTYEEVCSDTGKTKNLIRVDRNGVKIKTGFAKALGFNWELWMSLRELWSNMSDEDGYISEKDVSIEQGTVITLSFDEDNAFKDIWDNRHLYINEEKPLFELDYRTSVLENKEGYLRIYKQNILVYEDRDQRSNFAYNVRYAEIDERRILSDFYSVKNSIASSILSTDNEEYLKTIITKDYADSFLKDFESYSSATPLINKIAYEVYEKEGDVKSYNFLIEAVKKRNDCKIPGKIIRTISDSMWTYSTDVEVESFSREVEPTLKELIEEKYDFNVNVTLRKAQLKGSKVVADKFEKCIFVSEDFNVEEDFADFIVQYIDLTEKGNVLENLSVFITEKLRK